jgi:hypothetical protein
VHDRGWFYFPPVALNLNICYTGVYVVATPLLFARFNMSHFASQMEAPRVAGPFLQQDVTIVKKTEILQYLNYKNGTLLGANM